MAKPKSPIVDGSDFDFIDDIYKQIGQNDCNQDVSDWLSTGFLPLDYILSGKYQGGGYPQGRISELSGGESSGKTLQITMAMIETQRKGGLAVLLDHEHAFSIARARQLGLSIEKHQWIYKQPTIAEDGLAIIEYIAEARAAKNSSLPVTICIDSVASMLTKLELEADFDKINMKTRLSLASLLSTSLKKIAGLISRSNITLLFVNQLRANPGIMFGEKEDTTGGKALKFYSSARVRLSKIGKIKDGDKIIGDNVVAQVIKNKCAEPWGKVQYISNFREGINLYGSHLATLNAMGLLGDTKGWMILPSGEKFRAKDLEHHCRTDATLYADILKLFTPDVAPPEPVTGDESPVDLGPDISAEDILAA